MLSFNECKKILNAKGNKYTDEQVKEVNEFMEMLAEIIVSDKILVKIKRQNGKSSNNGKSVKR